VDGVFTSIFGPRRWPFKAVKPLRKEDFAECSLFIFFQVFFQEVVWSAEHSQAPLQVIALRAIFPFSTLLGFWKRNTTKRNTLLINLFALESKAVIF